MPVHDHAVFVCSCDYLKAAFLLEQVTETSMVASQCMKTFLYVGLFVHGQVRWKDGGGGAGGSATGRRDALSENKLSSHLGSPWIVEWLDRQRSETVQSRERR